METIVIEGIEMDPSSINGISDILERRVAANKKTYYFTIYINGSIINVLKDNEKECLNLRMKLGEFVFGDNHYCNVIQMSEKNNAFVQRISFDEVKKSKRGVTDETADTAAQSAGNAG